MIARLAVCLAAGALMACATPPMNVYPLAWLGMIPLAWLLAEAAETPASIGRLSLRLAAYSFAFAFATNLVALRFASTVVSRFAHLPSFVAPLALLALAGFEASRWVTAGIAYGLLVRAGIGRPASFALGVYLGTFVPTVIPWTVACGVCPWPATVQLAEIVGERGVAALMALEAALSAESVRLLRQGNALARRRARPPFAIAAALVVLTVTYGALRVRQIDALRAAAPKVAIALVEPAVSATDRWRDEARHELLQRLTTLTRRAEDQGVDLVVWPEASYPFNMAHVSRHAPSGDLAIVQPGVRGPVLTGLIMTGDFGKYNSAVVATRDGLVSEPYDKMHLMWFGEFVPFGDAFPWLRKAFARGVGLRPGERSVALEAGRVRAGVLVCLEDILPAAGREAMGTAPNLLVNVTNDAWFAGTAESELHLRLARLRSVELRRDLVRAVNGGPATHVDAAGRIVALDEPDSPGLLVTHPALLEAPPSPYARYGDLPLSLVAGVYVAGAIGARRLRRQAAQPATT